MKIMKDKEIALVKEILAKLGASEEDQELVAEATIDAGMPGTVTKLIAAVGSEVAEGEVVMIIEAMKMEVEIKAAKNCVIKEFKVAQGDVVEQGAVLAVIEEK